MGLVILAAIFALPIGSAQNTFYKVVEPLLGAIGDIRYLPTEQMIFSYILIIAFILLVIAGLVGFFPLGTGVLGIVGMAMLSLAPGFVGLEVEWGAGFYVLWAASIVAIGASFWHKRGLSRASQSQVVQVTVQPPAYPPTPSPPPPSQPSTPSPTVPPPPPSGLPVTPSQSLPPAPPVSRSVKRCPVCGTNCIWIGQYNRWYCSKCREYR